MMILDGRRNIPDPMSDHPARRLKVDGPAPVERCVHSRFVLCGSRTLGFQNSGVPELNQRCRPAMIGNLRRSDKIAAVSPRLLCLIFLQVLDFVLLLGCSASSRTLSCWCCGMRSRCSATPTRHHAWTRQTRRSSPVGAENRVTASEQGVRGRPRYLDRAALRRRHRLTGAGRSQSRPHGDTTAIMPDCRRSPITPGQQRRPSSGTAHPSTLAAASSTQGVPGLRRTTIGAPHPRHGRDRGQRETDGRQGRPHSPPAAVG